MADNEQKELTLEEANKKIEELTQERDNNLNGWKRAKADYINFKNDQEKRAKELAQFAGLNTIASMLPVAESLRMACSQIPEDIKDSEWTKGVEQIYSQMKEALKTLGVEQITDLVGTQFNPEQHEAVGQEEDEEKEDGEILKEMTAGYSLHGKVLTPARVVVNKRANK